MTYPFQCPHCSGIFQIAANFAGQPVACPHCNRAVLIPDMSPPAVNSPPITPAAPPIQAQSAEPPTAPLPVTIPTPINPVAELGQLSSAPAAPDKAFVIPTFDGGQAVLHEPTRIAVSGSKRRQLRDLTSEERTTRRWIKNLIVFGVCGVLLVAVFWWLLSRGPLQMH